MLVCDISMLLLLLFTETVTYYHQYQRQLKTDESTGEQYIESTPEDVETAFMLLETTLLKKSDELSDACHGFFEKLKAYLREQDTDSFHSRDVRSSLRINPSNLKRYLNELDRMGHIRIVKGNRYKGFEYKVQQWQDMEDLEGNTRSLIEGVLAEIRSLSVGRSPSVVPPGAKSLKPLFCFLKTITHWEHWEVHSNQNNAYYQPRKIIING